MHWRHPDELSTPPQITHTDKPDSTAWTPSLPPDFMGTLRWIKRDPLRQFRRWPVTHDAVELGTGCSPIISIVARCGGLVGRFFGFLYLWCTLDTSEAVVQRADRFSVPGLGRLPFACLGPCVPRRRGGVKISRRSAFLPAALSPVLTPSSTDPGRRCRMPAADFANGQNETPGLEGLSSTLSATDQTVRLPRPPTSPPTLGFARTLPGTLTDGH